MLPPRLAFVALCLSSFVSGQATGGSIVEVGNTQIGALMVSGVRNESSCTRY